MLSYDEVRTMLQTNYPKAKKKLVSIFISKFSIPPKNQQGNYCKYLASLKGLMFLLKCPPKAVLLSAVSEGKSPAIIALPASADISEQATVSHLVHASGGLRQVRRGNSSPQERRVLFVHERVQLSGNIDAHVVLETPVAVLVQAQVGSVGDVQADVVDEEGAQYGLFARRSRGLDSDPSGAHHHIHGDGLDGASQVVSFGHGDEASRDATEVECAADASVAAHVRWLVAITQAPDARIKTSEYARCHVHLQVPVREARLQHLKLEKRNHCRWVQPRRCFQKARHLLLYYGVHICVGIPDGASW